ncbi:peptidoglycan DD-metalloendopeptidase family protein [Dongshaea marina]|uniref:peptidoglycan DD-metalloendopeptidase family protein n=1 Tax=Dongshaea marina TaxID=2047966 RepID=UPI000D3EC3CD|nr:peptidoglycan DD-metalloendopeptidase family protein [Dongshaea marina]
MKNSYRITISDLHGTRHFSVKKIMFRYLAYAAIFTLLLLGIGTAIISYLSHRVDLARQQVVIQQHTVSGLKGDISQLMSKKREIENSLDDKRAELVHFNLRMDELEQTLGLRSERELREQEKKAQPDSHEVELRLQNLATDSVLRAVMLELIPSGKPLEYRYASSKFGMRENPITKKRERHPGIDLVASMGTPIYAPADGVVEYMRRGKKGYGNFMILNHSFGFTTLYGHLSKFNVSYGKFVHKGDLIAWSGNSGDSTGPHLHYEVRFLSRVLDPVNFMNWSSTNFSQLFSKEKRVKWASLVAVIDQTVRIPQQLLSPVVVASREPSP